MTQSKEVEQMLRCLLDRDEKSTSVEYTCTALARSLPFYLQSYGHEYSHSGYFIERSGLESYLLIHTLSRCGVLRDSKTKTILSPGSVVIIDCNQYQYYSTIHEGHWVFEWLHFNGMAAQQFYSIIKESSPAAHISDACFLQFYNRLSELTGQIGIETDILINSLITNLLSSVICSRHQEISQQQIYKYQSRLESAAQFIWQHCNENIYVNEVAAVADMSQYQFERLFKAYYGKTPYEYLCVARITTAKQLLHHTQSSIAEIADFTGFSNSSCFIRSFKSITGITPLKYRLFAIE